jgi:hypothetical protein
MVLYQGTDGEFAESGPILERITKSLTFNAEPVLEVGDDADVAEE